VADLEKNGGKMSTLLNGVIGSTPFQKLRNPAVPATSLAVVNPAQP
jgi:hypothetical protein